MGVKEFRFLKKTLSEIESKKTKLLNSEKSRKGINIKISDLKKSISEEGLSYSSAEQKCQKLQKKEKFSEEDSQKLDAAYIELKKIEKKCEGKATSISQASNSDFFEVARILIIAALILLFLFGHLFFGSGWITLLFDSEGDLVFECENGEQMAVWRVNDGTNDCGDNSDENVPVTPELSDRIARSNDDSDTAFYATCCVLPLFLGAFFAAWGRIDLQNMVIDNESKNILKKRRSQITRLERKKDLPNEIKRTDSLIVRRRSKKR